jgi:tetratricopeptide (TPR) repeat protein
VLAYLQHKVAPRLVLNSEGEDVFTSAAAISEMAGWMAHDAGDNSAARQHFARALNFVTVSNDRQLTAHVQASIGHLAHHMHDGQEAVRAARAGLAALAHGPRNPDLEARLHAVEAKGHAVLRNVSPAVQCLSMAGKALEVDRQEPLSAWVSSFDEGALASDEARCMRQLGQLDAAHSHAQRVIELRPPSRARSRAFGMFIRAHVLLAQGNPDEASAVAAEILDATEDLGSQIITQQFTELRQGLKPYKGSPSVDGFLQRLNPALRQRLWIGSGIGGAA